MRWWQIIGVDMQGGKDLYLKLGRVLLGITTKLYDLLRLINYCDDHRQTPAARCMIRAG